MEIGAFEAKNKLSALLERAARGEEIVITRRGRPVAKLVSARARHDVGAAQRAAGAVRRLAHDMRLGRFDWREWKGYRDAGRR